MPKKITAGRAGPHSPKQTQIPEPNPIAHLSKKLTEILKKVNQGETLNNEELLDRIREVKLTAKAALLRLQIINEELCERASADLFPHINQVIIPAITETSKIINIFDQALNANNPIPLGSDELVDQINKLNNIYAKWKDMKSIENSVLERVIHKVTDIVKETRQQIDNYKIYKLAETTEHIDDDVHDEIENYLQKSFQELENTFYEMNKGLDLSTAGKAVENIRAVRERIFDNSLQKIDELVPTNESAQKVEIEHPILELEIKFIREEIKLVQIQMKNLDFDNEKSIEELFNYVDSIHEQIEELIQYARSNEQEELHKLRTTIKSAKESCKPKKKGS